jgi:hypothetical protein
MTAREEIRNRHPNMLFAPGSRKGEIREYGPDDRDDGPDRGRIFGTEKI